MRQRWKRGWRQISVTCHFITTEILLLRARICNMSWWGRLICIYNAKWSESVIMQNIFLGKKKKKKPSAISPLFHCETTAVPFKMATRLIFMASFFFLFTHYVVRDGICLNETSLSKGLSAPRQEWMQQGDARLLGNTNLLIAYIYSIPVSISTIIRMGHVTSALCVGW